MAQAHYIKKALKDIYQRGKSVSYISKKGKKEGETKHKIDRTIPADDKDIIIIHKGEGYWWWQFRHGGKNISKERPRNSQLTQSGFLSQLYDIQERIEDMVAANKDDFEMQRDEFVSDVENLRDECQNSLDNMPEALQESSSSGQLLTERIEALESWQSELEGIECDYDEEELRQEAADNLGDDSTDDEKVEEYQRLVEDKVSEAIAELQNCDCGL